MIYNALAMAQVMRDPRFSRGRLEELVHKRLKKVLVSAYIHVPYYQEIMKKVGYNPTREYRGPEDLRKLPITTKEVLKRRGVQEFTKSGSDLSNFFTDTTSGSTGIPIRVYRSPYERSLQIAKWLRVLFVNGYSVRDRVMSFTSPPRLSEGKSVFQQFGILRRLAVDHSLDHRLLAEHFLREKPDVLYASFCHLELVALELKKRGIRPKPLKLLIGTGEMISETSRKLCREIFGVELVESYGSVEMGVMAYETPAHDGLHPCEDLTYFEFLDDQEGPVPTGEPGKIVMTDLTGRLMPFIRYEQGDRAVYRKVEDKYGNNVWRITKVIGREDDYAILPDGSKRTRDDFVTAIQKYPYIQQYRIIQKQSGLFQIIIASDQSYFNSIHNDLLQKLHGRFPTEIKFDIVRVDRINPDPTGKLRKFICMIQ